MRSRVIVSGTLTCIIAAHCSLAATFVVDPGGIGDFPTIQDGITAIANGDTIILSNGVFTGPGNYDINLQGKTITIRSESGDPSLCTIDCQGTAAEPRRGFYLGSGETIETRIEGITIRNAFAPLEGGGAVYAENSSFTMRNCVITENRMTSEEVSSLGGAGMRVVNGSPVIADCQITRNGTDGPFGSGGGISGSDGSAVILRCLIANNTAGHGAADGGGISWQSGTAYLEDCIVTRNLSDMGGGLSLSGTIRGCTIIDNGSSDGISAGILGSNLNISSTILRDSAYLGGGMSSISCSAVDTTKIMGDFIFSGYNWFGDPGFCDRQNGDLTLRGDSACLPQNNPCDQLIGALASGCGPTSVYPPSLSARPRLVSTFPNPLNPSTTIQFELPSDMFARLHVCDVSGRIVATLVDDWTPSGLNSVSWSGLDERGTRVASGIYFCRLNAGGMVEAKKIAVLK